jgi:hypothetical protein
MKPLLFHHWPSFLMHDLLKQKLVRKNQILTSRIFFHKSSLGGAERLIYFVFPIYQNEIYRKNFDFIFDIAKKHVFQDHVI